MLENFTSRLPHDTRLLPFLIRLTFFCPLHFPRPPDTSHPPLLSLLFLLLWLPLHLVKRVRCVCLTYKKYFRQSFMFFTNAKFHCLKNETERSFFKNSILGWMTGKQWQWYHKNLFDGLIKFSCQSSSQPTKLNISFADNTLSLDIISLSLILLPIMFFWGDFRRSSTHNGPDFQIFFYRCFSHLQSGGEDGCFRTLDCKDVRWSSRYFVWERSPDG